jgi:hypothetical protein
VSGYVFGDGWSESDRVFRSRFVAIFMVFRFRGKGFLGDASMDDDLSVGRDFDDGGAFGRNVGSSRGPEIDGIARDARLGPAFGGDVGAKPLDGGVLKFPECVAVGESVGSEEVVDDSSGVIFDGEDGVFSRNGVVGEMASDFGSVFPGGWIGCDVGADLGLKFGVGRREGRSPVEVAGSGLDDGARFRNEASEGEAPSRDGRTVAEGGGDGFYGFPDYA